MKRLFLTGSSGFVGTHLSSALQIAFPDVETIGLRSPADARSTATSDGRCADIADSAAIDAIVGEFKPDVIFHLAGQASAAQSLSHASETWRVNAGGTLALASAAAKHVPDVTFVNISSSEVYGASFRNGEVNEESPLAPQNVYAHSKASAEVIASDVLPPTARLVILRPFNHSGAGQDDRFVLPAFANQIAHIESGLQEPLLKVGNLDAKREFLHITDVIAAYVALLSSLQQLPKRNIFNIASGQPHRIGDLLEKMSQRARVPFKIEIDPQRLRQSEISVASGSAALFHGLTGWMPVHPIDDLIDEILMDARSRISR